MTLYSIFTDDMVLSPISPLDQNVWLKGPYKFSRVSLEKNRNIVYHLQGCNQLRPFRLRENRAVWAFDFLNRTVAIEGYDEKIPEFFCFPQ